MKPSPVVAVLPPEINIASEYINIISRTTKSNIDSNKCGWQPVSLSAVGWWPTKSGILWYTWVPRCPSWPFSSVRNEFYRKKGKWKWRNGTGYRNRTRDDSALLVESIIAVMLNGFAKHRPLSTLEYEQQLDYLCQWMEKWSDQVVR